MLSNPLMTNNPKKIKSYKYARQYADQDYKNGVVRDGRQVSRPLTQYELQWLESFNNQYYFQAQYQRDSLFTDDEKKELNKADYQRRWDVMNKCVQEDLQAYTEDQLSNIIEDTKDDYCAVSEALKYEGKNEAIVALFDEVSDAIKDATDKKVIHANLRKFYRLMRKLERAEDD